MHQNSCESDRWQLSYDVIKIFKMAAVDVANQLSVLCDSAHALRRSVSLNVRNFVKLSQSTVDLQLLSFWENELPSCWNLTPGFDFNLAIVIGISFCIGVRHQILCERDGRRPSYNVMSIYTARRSYASAVLGVVILSVCPSVFLSVRPSHAWFVTNPKNLPAIFFIPHERAILLVFWRQIVSDIAIFVLKRDVKLQLTNFWCQRSRRNSNGAPQRGRQIEVG